MGYAGNTFGIPFSRGGVNNSINYDDFPANDMLPTSRNFNLVQGGRRKRGGTTRVSGELDSGVRIYGMFDYLKPGGTQYTVFATSTKIWQCADPTWGTPGTIKTSWTASKYVWFSQFQQEVYACNGVDMPVLWAGSGQSSALAGTPTDWDTVNSKPKYMVTHGRGESERNWAFGCAATPYTLYISPNDDGDDFSDANVILLPIDTKDGYGIVGGIVFQDKFMAFGKTQTYIVDDADALTANWGYYAAAWEGGAIGQKMIVKTPNDIHVMSEDLDVYSVMAAERYSDYKAASLARPAHIDQWLRDNVETAYLDDFHGIYDPKLRAVRWFIVRSGQTTSDTCLLYFIDRPPNEAWMIHNSDAAASGYFASCSTLKRIALGDYQIYTGDYSGYIWKLEQSSKLDNAKKYTAQFKSAPTPFNDSETSINARIPKDFKRGRLGMTPQGTETASIAWWVDGVAGTTRAITAVAGVYDYEFELGAKGRRFQYQVLSSASNSDSFFSNVLIDYKPLGKKVI